MRRFWRYRGVLLIANILIKMASGAKISKRSAAYFCLNNDQIGRRYTFSTTMSDKSYKLQFLVPEPSGFRPTTLQYRSVGQLQCLTFLLILPYVKLCLHNSLNKCLSSEPRIPLENNYFKFVLNGCTASLADNTFCIALLIYLAGFRNCQGILKEMSVEVLFSSCFQRRGCYSPYQR